MLAFSSGITLTSVLVVLAIVALIVFIARR